MNRRELLKLLCLASAAIVLPKRKSIAAPTVARPYALHIDGVLIGRMNTPEFETVGAEDGSWHRYTITRENAMAGHVSLFETVMLIPRPKNATIDSFSTLSLSGHGYIGSGPRQVDLHGLDNGAFRVSVGFM